MTTIGWGRDPSQSVDQNGRRQRRLWQALSEAKIQVIATDHAPHTLEEKRQPYPASPSGLPSVENSLALMLNEVNQGGFTLVQLVHWMCEAPARVWDIVGKGKIEVGYDADLVLVDLARQHTIRNAAASQQVRLEPLGRSHAARAARADDRGAETVFADGRWDEDHRGQEAVFDHALGGYWATAT